jgi:hypothetical protein
MIRKQLNEMAARPPLQGGVVWGAYCAAVGTFTVMNQHMGPVTIQTVAKAFRVPESTVHAAVNHHNRLIERDGIILVLENAKTR